MADSSINIKIGADSKKAVDELKKISSQFESMKKVATVVGGAILGAFAFDKLVDGFKAVVSSAEESEKAITQLNVALKLAGSFSEQASQDFQKFANRIQDTTTFTDEAVLSSVALAKQFNATNEQARAMVSAATDLAAATGVDLNTATRMLGQTLDGTAGKIAEQIPQIRGLTKEQLRAGDAIDIVAARFRGAAEASGNTFSGAVTKAHNAFDDLLEVIGEFIIKNPFVIKGIHFVTEGFKSLKKFIEDNRLAILKLVKDSIVGMANFATSVVSAIQAMDRPFSTLITMFEDIFAFMKRLPELGRAVKLAIASGSMRPLELLDKDMTDAMLARNEKLNANLQQRADIYDTIKGKLTGFSSEVEKMDPSKMMTNKDPSSGVENGPPAGPAPKTAAEQKEIFDKAAGFVGALKQGAEGAATAVASAAGMVADVIIPGLGGLVTQIFEFLAQGPELVAQQIQAFVDAIPRVVENIILAIPVVLRAFIEKVPELINALIAKIPDIIKQLVAQFPGMITALINSFIPQMPFIAMQITIEIIKNIPQIIIAFAQEFMKIPGQFAQKLFDAIGDIGSIFGFAQGGMVAAAGGFGLIQGGYPGKDTVPVMAQAGELIVPRANFNEVIEAVSAARMANAGQAQAQGFGNGGGGQMQVVIGFEGDAAERVLTARQVEARSLGTLREA